MSQKDKETFKEYAQRWRELVAKINPPLEEKEMTKIFLKTLSSFYYKRMIASALSDFTEMVNIRMRLEEGVREGRLSKEEVSSSKKYGNSFTRKKGGETNTVLVGRQRRPHVRRSTQPRQHHHQVSSVIPVVQTIKQCQFNNNVNNSRNKEQTTTTPTPLIINNNRVSRGRRSLLTLFLRPTPNYTHLWFSRTCFSQGIRHKFQNHFHGGISPNSAVPFIKELPFMILRIATH
jgi:hypothetical protein